MMEKHKYIVFDYYEDPDGEVIGEAASFLEAQRIRYQHLEDTYGERDTIIKRVEI